jgi:hypothetical protein
MLRKLSTLVCAVAAALAFGPAALHAEDRFSTYGIPFDPCASGPLERAARTGGFSVKAPLRVVGLTAGGQLVCFLDKLPHLVLTLGNINGLSGDTRLLAIDFRPQDGLLYGLGDAGGLYRIDTATAMAFAIGRLTQPLTGPTTTIDFNPAANALRIIGSDGQNLRQPFATMPLVATANDDPLNFTVNATPGPRAAGIIGAAYTNNDVDPRTGTTLFVLDSSGTGDRVAVQSPANAGFLVAAGSLGVDAAGVAGFDIYSVLRENVTVDQRALAALSVGGTVGLYDIELLTGKATPRGTIGSPSPVVSIAIPHRQL